VEVCFFGVVVGWLVVPASLAMKSPVRGREGVASSPDRRSNRPRTRPSRCGVGPMEVGVGFAELNSLRFVEGVVVSG
jgi:hypothetical protein